MARKWRTAGVLFFALLVAGCTTRSNEEKLATSGDRVGAVPTSIEVVKLDESGLERLLRQRNGKVLFLNVWATWCVQCVEEFPDLIRLHREFEGKPVEVVGVSADFDDEIESKIVPFLKKHNVPFRSYVASFKRQEDFISGIDRSWSGALPASIIVNPEGKKTFFFVGKGTFDQFKKEIDKTLGGL